jgi:hypothetical protein
VLLVEMALPGNALVEHWEEYPRHYVTSCQVVVAVPADLMRLENYEVVQIDDAQ